METPEVENLETEEDIKVQVLLPMLESKGYDVNNCDHLSLVKSEIT